MIRRPRRAFVASTISRLEAGELGGFDLWVRLHELLDTGHTPAETEEELARYMASLTGGEVNADSETT